MLRALGVLLVIVWAGALGAAQAETTISGVVERADGSLECGAVILFYPDGPSSGIQKKAVSNAQGEFSLTVSFVGPGILSASKVDEGYPDAVLALYSLHAYESVRELNLQGSAISGLRLRFSAPSPRIALNFKSRDRMLSSVRITVRAINGQEYRNISWDPLQVWDFVLPEFPVIILVQAPEREQWTYTTTAARSMRSNVLLLTADF